MKHHLITALLGATVLVAPVAAMQQTLELRVGESKSITLAGNPSTGFLWSLAAAADVVKVELALEQTPAPSGPPLCGRPCGTVVTLTGKTAGQGQVTLVYARPWEKNTAPARTCTINVTVK